MVLYSTFLSNSDRVHNINNHVGIIHYNPVHQCMMTDDCLPLLPIVNITQAITHTHLRVRIDFSYYIRKSRQRDETFCGVGER